ncbi:DUF2244 domain-containing protein [Alteromonas gilva]|uniref:DUF2244 domain-containing protein n=1 Tax=Alteromonas gilva TaxID=2987522 RepID=A0ABT5L120_9ALTE|nr:DUF2244 domain-containing protein [Alteromonas gilva]MDC8830578.1 DUF2244 domain-containing protein [Alteromonas gilva]
MIKVKHQGKYSLIELKPNRSADWIHNKWLMLAMAIVAFTIASAWALFGLWVVFPFAGIEIGLLCYLVYRVSHQTYRKETIAIEQTHIHIQSNQRQSMCISLLREDTHVELAESPLDWYLPQVKLVSGDNSVAIGEFLNQSDRHQLYEEIKKLGIPAWRHHWWKH